eukprot:306493-Pelagomonas_calceolata.AAC.1
MTRNPGSAVGQQWVDQEPIHATLLMNYYKAPSTTLHAQFAQTLLGNGSSFPRTANGHIPCWKFPSAFLLAKCTAGAKINISRVISIWPQTPKQCIQAVHIFVGIVASI